ncbi:MAG: Tat pathway signal protein [Clostridia bacterium]|nr:Tat pathway signal protein [Clostridia bacterium]
MSEPMIWSYLLHLSTHMWGDEHSTSSGYYLPDPYTPENNVDLATWDDTVRALGERNYNMVIIDLGDAVKYESHPEICAPDAWDKDFLKKKLDEMRALGIEPIPKLNFSACHHTWLKEYTRMVSSPIYYRVCADLIKEVCELFGNPRLFHLGFDEEIELLQRNREKVIVRGEKLWFHDLFFFAAECEKYGARPWIWSDYFWHHPDQFKKNMPKSILQSNWFYNTFQDWPEGHRYRTAIETYDALDELGYDQVPTGSTWSRHKNLYQTVAYAKNRLNPDLVKGFMTAPWIMTTRENRFRLLDDADRLFVAREKLYPETL